jgi:hypothetical protein
MNTEEFFAEFSGNEPASDRSLREIETHFGFALPKDYRAFLCSINGGEGFIGQSYVVLWKAEDVVAFNEDYETSHFSDGVMVIGSNGASEAFAYDNRTGVYVMVPFLFEEAAIIPQGATFLGFLERLYSDRIFEK